MHPLPSLSWLDDSAAGLMGTLSANVFSVDWAKNIAACSFRCDVNLRLLGAMGYSQSPKASQLAASVVRTLRDRPNHKWPEPSASKT